MKTRNNKVLLRKTRRKKGENNKPSDGHLTTRHDPDVYTVGPPGCISVNETIEWIVLHHIRILYALRLRSGLMMSKGHAYYMARRRKTKSDDDDDDNKNEIVGTAFTINRCILALVDAADGRYTYLLARII